MRVLRFSSFDKEAKIAGIDVPGNRSSSGSWNDVTRSSTKCSKLRRAACARVSTRCRAGPHCIKMMG